MDELLKKLLSAEVLTEETKQELTKAFETQLNEAITTAREEAKLSVTAELNEQWINERETLIEALDAKVTEALAEELNELRGDIENFRDLESEHAEKLVEAKSEMATAVKKDIAQLIEKLDTFLEIRLSTELEELREDVAVVKKQQFGKTVFEAFVTEFQKHYTADGSVEAKLTEAEERLEDAMAALEEAEKKTAKMARSIKLKEVLSPLSGRTREVMEAILKNVDTPMLEDAYSTYVGRVLKETATLVADTASEKESSVLAEGEKVAKPKGVVKSGNNTEQLDEEVVIEAAETKTGVTVLAESEKQRLRALAGIV
jgi:hypothetical protein